MQTNHLLRVFRVVERTVVSRLAPLSVFAVLSTIIFFGFQIGADTGEVRPDGNGTIAGTPTGCTSDLNWECLNDPVTEPAAPSTGSDYLTLVNNDTNFSLLQSVSDVDVVTEITVWYYHSEGGTNAQMTVGLYAANETTVHAGPTGITTRTSAQWDSVTYSGLSLSQAEMDAMRIELACIKTGGGGSNDCRAYAIYADVTYDPLIEVTVSQTGSQQDLAVGTTSAHVGGTFVITENVGSRNITSIEIEENGTVNAATNLDNIELYYDLDTSLPFDCVGETFDGVGVDTKFGSTDTDGFSAADGVSTFTGSVSITTTQTMCVYPVLDVLTGAAPTETIQIEINDPSADVAGSGSPDIEPDTTILLTGTTTLIAQDLDQLHYHWRTDDNDEANASSATGIVDDEKYDTLGKLATARLRIAVSNEGNTTSDTVQYKLQYAQKISTCGAAGGWTDINDAGGDWDMATTSQLAQGSNTTDIAESTGGVANSPGHTFLTPNAGQLETSDQSGNITLTSTQFVELEYAVRATAASTEGFQYCFRLIDGAASSTLDTYTVYPEATILADVNVSSEGTQQPAVDIPTDNVYLGADFIITDNILGTTTVDSITITASGTVDVQNDLNDIQLFYEFDISDPYNCVGESYVGGEDQYGSTDTNGFSAASTSIFSESLDINTNRTLCIYVEYDATSTVSNDETLDIYIDDASSDVTISSGSVSPAALVDLSGVTTFVSQRAVQAHYHWRNDDGDETGDETGASSATDGDEDTTRENLRQTVPQRLRIEVANDQSSTTPAYQYRLEYALKTSVCSSVSGWTDVGATDGAFDMFNSGNITDGDDTTNIATSTGGVTDSADTFLVDNNAVKDTSSQTAAITLAGHEFVELEYSILATASSTEGASYCFRVTDAGAEIDTYSVYPEVEIKPKTDFFIQRDVVTMSGTSATITAGTEYIAPNASTTAFIRITNTLNTGAGGGATGNADDVTVYISDPSNIGTSITFVRPAGATGNTRVAWEIIEYTGAPGGDNEITVRQQSIATYASGGTTVNTPTVSGVLDDTAMVVFITGSVNPDTTTNYPAGNSTAAWNAGSDTATFTRGVSGNTSGVSYAAVEFVGDNWKIQRDEHTYSAVGTTETSSTTAVNSLSRAFIHSQKRMGSGLTTHGDYGHQVWLSGIGQVSYVIDGTGSTPGSHTSVAWIIENTQNIGTTMVVTRSNGTQSGGASPTTLNVNIGKTIDDTQDASIFMNNLGDEPGGGGGQNSFPEPMMSARLISTTQYELWIADTSDSRSWRTEIVEWPTAARDIEQNYFMFFEDNDALDPTTPWPCELGPCGELDEIRGLDNPIAQGEVMRLRMTLLISSAGMTEGLDSFKLQYGERTSVCTAISEADWHNLGDIGSTTALWRGVNTSIADGTNLSTDPPAVNALNISVSDVAGTFEEENDTVVTPYEVTPGEDVEFDWAIEHNGAKEKTDYCFRMIEADETLFDDYLHHPVMRTAGYGPESLMWQWFDDAENETPLTSLAATNTAPIDVAFDNTIQLRYTLSEINGATEYATKFVLQFSEHSNFSTSTDVVETGACGELSLWCYADGGGVDNATITAALLEDSDACTGGIGAGCGSHNESGTTTSNFVHSAATAAEFAFTIRQAGARPNRVYYFRVYDIANDEFVSLGSGESYPSLITEGASLVFSMNGIASSTVTEGITTDVDSTPSSISFGSLPIGVEVEAAHRLNIDTNGTEGYQVQMSSGGFITNQDGDTIDPITSTNASPVGWSTACDAQAIGCFGYHSGDDILLGGSTRFSAVDTYARLSTTTPEEVLYSSTPILGETVDIIYKLQVQEVQPAGQYSTNLMYIAIPVF